MLHLNLKSSLRGQAAVLVALTLVVVVAAVGLALDGGNAFNQRRHTNNAADAAAMAATRAIITQKRDSGDGSAVNDAIETYLTAHLGNGTYSNTAFYINRQAQQLGPVDDGTDVPDDAQGVIVNVQYTFRTFFMTILGRDTLTVGGQGMALYGPLGSAIGGDLIPLAFDQSAMQTIIDSGGSEITIDLFGANAGTYNISPGNFGQVSYDPGGSNATGNNSSCGSSSPQDTIRYWWCQGSQYPVKIGQELSGRPGAVASNLESEIQWRIDNRPLALVPVIAYVSGSGNNTVYRVQGFLAVRLTYVNATGPLASRKVKARYVDYFSAPGAIIGEGNGIDTGTYGINLVR